MLKLEAVNTYYGDSHILRGVDVELPAATSLGLLGRNGMGKTTLIRTLMGYVRPASGHVLLDGIDVTGSPLTALSVLRTAGSKQTAPARLPSSVVSAAGDSTPQ